MRWFKHLSEASDDEFIQALEACFGWEGYGRWWKLCEAIGRRMKKDEQRASASLPVSTWCGILKAKRKQLEMFLGYLEIHGRIIRQSTGDILEITMPKLLKFRDEYARKSGHDAKATPDKLPPKRTDSREQKTESIDGVPVDVLFAERWEKYPKKDGRKPARQHFAATVRTSHDLTRFDRALNNYLKRIRDEKTKAKYIKNGATFFNNWPDFVDWQPAEQVRSLPEFTI